MEELRKLTENFQKNEVDGCSSLPRETKHLISLAVTTALGTVHCTAEETEKALHDGVQAEKISEAIIQCTPYAGSARALEALAASEEAMKKNGVSLPLQERGTVTEENRLEKGLAAQYAIFGQENIDHNRSSAPAELKHIQDYLSDYCFGDFYTREALPLKTRELLTFCILCTLGGCEPQLKAHIGGNLQVGNDRSVLLAALTWCIPYIGFPRTLNALACINEAAPAK